MPSKHATALCFALPTPQTDAAGAAQAPQRIKLLPAGSFAAHDGRPGNLEGSKITSWKLNDAAAQHVMQACAQAQRDFVIDYEHQTLFKASNGQPAPAAGWFAGVALEWVPGTGTDAGLYATDVRWTPRAAAMLAAGEYKYLSPVFTFDEDTGEVTALLHVALTNDPALDELPALAALTARIALTKPLSQPPSNQEKPMDKTAVLVALGLPATTTDETALAALSALRPELDTLRANQFDPAKHIPLAEHQKVTEQLAALTAQADQAEHGSLMTAALADARILPANEAYWRAQPVAALKAFLKDAKPLAALTTMQTTGTTPPATGTVALSAEEREVCKLMGLTPEAFAKAKAAETPAA